MKQYFSEWSYKIRTEAKAAHCSVADYGVRLRSNPRLRSGMTASDGQLLTEWGMLAGRGTDWFIESTALACKILELCPRVELHILKSISRFDHYSASQVESAHRLGFGVKKLGPSIGVIHTPSGNGNAVLFSIIPNHDDGGVRHICCWGTDGFSQLDAGDKDLRNKASLRLVFATALYVSCFPHAVKPGFPEFAKHPAHYSHHDKCASIEAVPEVLDRNGPKPHWRNGHYRFLDPEKFPKKGGRWIFWSGCFVKGEAKTITEIE